MNKSLFPLLLFFTTATFLAFLIGTQNSYWFSSGSAHFGAWEFCTAKNQCDRSDDPSPNNNEWRVVRAFSLLAILSSFLAVVGMLLSRGEPKDSNTPLLRIFNIALHFLASFAGVIAFAVAYSNLRPSGFDLDWSGALVVVGWGLSFINGVVYAIY